MKYVYNQLIQYLINNNLIDDYLLANYGLNMICFEMIKKDSFMFVKTLRQILIQKQKNEIFKREIINLNKRFNEKKIRVIFLKGVILASELYNPASIRKSGDIDILIEIQSVEEALNILSEIGFSQRGIEPGKLNVATKWTIPISGDYYKEYISDFPLYRSHFPMCQKYIGEKNLNYLSLDCHLSIFYGITDLSIISNCFSSVQENYLLKNKIFTLCFEYKLIHLISHFSKETFRDNVYWIFTGWKEGRKYVKINLIHDIALLLYKNISNVKWDIILKYVIELKQEIFFFFFAKFLNDIYKISIPNYIIDTLEIAFSSSRNLAETILYECKNMNSFDIIFSDQYKLMEIIIKKIKLKKLICDNIGRFYFDILKPSNGRELECIYSELKYGTVYIDVKEHDIKLNIIIYNGQRYKPFYPSIILQVGDGYVIDRYKCITPKLMLNINDDLNIKNSTRLFIGTEQFKSNFQSHVDIYNNDLYIYLTIDKEILPIKFDNTLFLNVEIEERDEKGENKRTPVQFMSEYDIKNFKVINKSDNCK